MKSSLTAVEQVAMGRQHVFARTASGAFAWGNNALGQLLGSRDPRALLLRAVAGKCLANSPRAGQNPEPIVKRALLVLGFLLPVGCVLLVDDVETFGKDCPIQGADTACGSCLRANCQAAVNACCGDSACDASRIDQCALGACTAKFQGQAWEHCALSACGAACGLVSDGGVDGSADALTDANSDVTDAPEDSFTPPTVTGCTTSFDSCSCAAGAAPNGVVCDKTKVDNGYCCADATWPALGNCRCQKLSCETISGDCECGIVQDGPLSSCQPTTSSPNCCARQDFGTCLCSNKICESWVGNPVAACTPETTPCPNGGKSVTSCSY